MTKDEMIKNDRREIVDLLYKLKNGELCTPNCYGCCGDNELSFAYCPDVTDNFEKELANLGYRKVADDEIVESMKTYERARQETAIEILQKLKDNIMLADFGCGDGYEEVVDMNTDELKQLAKKYGIELEV